MTELQVFDGDLAEQVFMIVSLVCAAVFFGVALLQRPAQSRTRVAAARA